MAEKALFVDMEKCTGCRLCEIVCSLQHTNTCNPARSRINVMKWEEDGINVPFMCQQCEDPLCAQACPMNAIEKDEETGVIRTDYEKCIGCRMCIMACPMGGTTFDPIEKKVIRCDLCGGDPLCAKICPTGAIVFGEVDRMALEIKRKGVERFFIPAKDYGRIIEGGN